MSAGDRVPFLNSIEAERPTGVWNWARNLVEELRRWRKIIELVDLDLTGKAGYKLVVNADENGFELVP